MTAFFRSARPARRGGRRRMAAAAASAALAALALAAPASGHAVVSPPVALSGTLQVFTLSVPTEAPGERTTTVELTVPPGFAIDSFAPAAGWRRRVAATGRGEAAVVTRVTWSRGSVPTGEDAVFQFNATAASARRYTFAVGQTYSSGRVVDWSGPEGSDTPAPRLEAKGSLGGGGTSAVSIAALVAGTLGVLLGLAALLSRTGERPLT